MPALPGLLPGLSRYKSLLFRLVALVAFSCLLSSDLLAQDIAAKVDEYMKAGAKMDRFSSAVLVAREGKVLVAKGYGWANREDDILITSKTKFRVGSITKQFTAAAILLLQDRGQLNVEDPVCKYFSDCPAAWAPITIHHVLTHTSGIPNHTSLPGYGRQQPLPTTPAETMALVKDKPLDFKPGENFNYSNSGYVVLGMIIERLSGKTYAAFLRENIFEPLKMLDTGYDDMSTILKHRAAGYGRRGDGELVNARYLDMTRPYAAGSLYSTVEDLYLWDQALYGQKLLSQKSLNQMFTPFRDNYAYGWSVATQFNRKLVTHAGGINGFSSTIVRFPQDKVTVIVLSNIQDAPSGIIARDLAAIVFGEKYTVPVEHKEIKLDAKIYDAYVGEYELAPNRRFIVTKEGDRLWLAPAGQPGFQLFPEAATKFFAKVNDALFTFTKNDQGQVTHLVIEQNGVTQQGQKIK